MKSGEICSQEAKPVRVPAAPTEMKPVPRGVTGAEAPKMAGRGRGRGRMKKVSAGLIIMSLSNSLHFQAVSEFN